MNTNDALLDAGENFPGNGASEVGEVGSSDGKFALGAEERGGVGGGDVWGVGDIHHDLVHGDAAEDRARRAMDEDVGSASGESAWVAVCIAYGERGDACGAAGNERAAVAYRVSWWQGSDEGDTCVDAHGWLKGDRGGGNR